MLVASFDPADGATVVEPPAPGPGNWVGAASALVDRDGERLFVAFRRRRPRGGPPRGRGLRATHRRELSRRALLFHGYARPDGSHELRVSPLASAGRR